MNSQNLVSDTTLKYSGYSNTTFGLSLPSLAHDSIQSYVYQDRKIFRTSEFLKTEKDSYVVFVEQNKTNMIKIGKLIKEENELKLEDIKIIEIEEKFMYENLTCRGILHKSNNPQNLYLGHCVIFNGGRSKLYFKIPVPEESSKSVKVETKMLTYPVLRFHSLTEPDGKLTDNYYLAYRRDQSEETRGFVDCIIWYFATEEKIIKAVKNYRFSLNQETFETNVYSGAFEAENGDLYFQKNSRIFRLRKPEMKK